MTENVIVALLGLVGVTVTASSVVLAALVARQSKQVKEVRAQVANSHILPNGEPYNLRDNIDHNQAAVLGEIRGIKRDIGRLDERDIQRTVEMRYMNQKLDGLASADQGAADRLNNIEDTLDLRKDRR